MILSWFYNNIWKKEDTKKSRKQLHQMKQQQRKSYISESLGNATALNSNLNQFWKWKNLLKKLVIQKTRRYAEVTCSGKNPTRRLSKTKNADNNKKQNAQKTLLSKSKENDSEDKGTISSRIHQAWTQQTILHINRR